MVPVDAAPTTSRRRSATSTATSSPAHPLRREIVTNAVVNSMVNRGGITFAFRAAEETGATPEQVARAFVVCREVFDLTALRRRGGGAGQRRRHRRPDRALPGVPPAARPVGPVVPAEPPVVPGRRAPRSSGSARWSPSTARRCCPCCRGRSASGSSGGSPSWRRRARRAEIATRAAGLLDQYSLLDVVEICAETGRDASEVAPVYFATSEQFGIDGMLTRVTRLPRDDRWDALARGALRDDLYAVAGVTDHLGPRGQRPGQTATERIAQWAKTNAESLTRARTALSGIERIENPGIAALSVALRTLRGVIRSGAATT